MSADRTYIDVTLNSELSDNGSKDTPEFYLDPIDNVVAIGIEWVNIPYAYFTIDRTCNVFSYRMRLCADDHTWDGTTYQSTDFTITPGTYSPETLIKEFYRMVSKSGIVAARGIKLYYDQTNSRCILYSTDLDQTSIISIKTENVYLARILGLPVDTWVDSAWDPEAYLNGSLVVTNHTPDASQPLNAKRFDGAYGACQMLKFPGILNLSFAPLIEVRSNELSSILGESQRGQSEVGNSICSIPVTNNFTGFIYYKAEAPPIAIRRQSFSKIDLSLGLPTRTVYSTNNFDTSAVNEVNYLPLNGMSFQIRLRLYVDNGIVNGTGNSQ